MLTKGTASLLTLFAVVGLQEWQLLAAPGIENAAYTSQDLLAEASASPSWVQRVAPVSVLLRRLRRYDMDYPGDGGHCHHNHPGGHNHHHGGHRRHNHHHHPHGHGHGYGHGHHMHGQGPPHQFGPGFNPWHERDFNSHNGPPRRPEGVSSFERDVESGEDFNNLPIVIQSTKPTNPTNTTPQPSSPPSSTTEDSTLNIDIRIGS